MTRAVKEEAKVVQVAIPADMELHEVIRKTLEQLPALRYMDGSVRRDVYDAIMHALGHADKHMIAIPLASDPIPFCGPDAELLKAIQDLLDYRPEGGYAEGFGEFAVKCDDARFFFLETESDDPAVQAAEYQSFVDGGRYEDENGKRRYREPAPLLTQIVSYPLLGGKHNGRGFMGRVRALRHIAGLPEED